MKSKQVKIIVCQIGESPTLLCWEVHNPESAQLLAQQCVGGHFEIIPYPRQLKLPNLSVVVNANAIHSNLPYNRWGMAGSFFITRFDRNGRQQSLSTNAIDQVLDDLKASSGYIDKASGLNNFFREQGMDREPPSDPLFFINPNWPDYFRQGKTRRSLPAEDFKSQGGKWNPQLHFTGKVDIDELRFIESLLDEFADHIVAHHISFPLAGAFSIELQFANLNVNQAAMSDCRNKYHDYNALENIEVEDI